MSVTVAVLIIMIQAVRWVSGPVILWAYIEKEKGLPGEGINTRYNPRLPYSR